MDRIGERRTGWENRMGDWNIPKMQRKYGQLYSLADGVFERVRTKSLSFVAVPFKSLN